MDVDALSQIRFVDGPVQENPKTESTAPTTELEGLWDFVYPKEQDAPPPDERVRLVYSGDLHATFQGQRQIALWRMKLEPKRSPKRITLDGVRSMRGIYEIKDEGLRLSLAYTDAEFPTKFGTERPEFKRVSVKPPKDLLDKMLDVNFNRTVKNRLSETVESTSEAIKP